MERLRQDNTALQSILGLAQELPHAQKGTLLTNVPMTCLL